MPGLPFASPLLQQRVGGKEQKRLKSEHSGGTSSSGLSAKRLAHAARAPWRRRCWTSSSRTRWEARMSSANHRIRGPLPTSDCFRVRPKGHGRLTGSVCAPIHRRPPVERTSWQLACCTSTPARVDDGTVSLHRASRGAPEIAEPSDSSPEMLMSPDDDLNFLASWSVVGTVDSPRGTGRESPTSLIILGPLPGLYRVRYKSWSSSITDDPAFSRTKVTKSGPCDDRSARFSHNVISAEARTSTAHGRRARPGHMRGKHEGSAAHRRLDVALCASW